MYSLKVDNRCNTKKVKLKQSFVALKKKKEIAKQKEKLNFLNMCLLGL